MVLISSLYLLHNSCGLVMFRSVCPCTAFSISVWSFIPLLTTARVSFLFCSEAIFQVHLPVPMSGALRGQTLLRLANGQLVRVLRCAAS